METTSAQLQVKIISIETVKPSSATPSHLRNFALSMLDQLSAPLHITALLFYNPTTQTPPVDVTRLRTALSLTLTKFYPLAGRCKDESTIICNDEGVPFVEARVNCGLSHVLNSSGKLELLSKFQLFPPKELLASGKQHISELVHLAFQVNVFDCGGVVIGLYMLHKIMDGSSLGVFFRHWSALANDNYTDLINPDFGSIVTAFPPYLAQQKEQEQPEQEATMPDYYKVLDESLNIVGKGFIFSDESVVKLKLKAASTLVPYPTRFESVLGFIWEQALAAEAAVTDAHAQHPSLLFAANMRKRLDLHAAEGSIGNFATFAIAFAEKQELFPGLVAQIHAAILKVGDQIAEFQGENGAVALLDQQKKYVAGHKAGTYIVSSWCRNGLAEADFGFGKPRWIVFPVTERKLIPARRNCITLTDYTNNSGVGGITAWVYLEEKEMQALEANQEFLAFASPW